MNVAYISFVIKEKTQSVAVQFLQFRHNPRDSAVGYIHFMLAPAFAAKTKAELRTFHVHMPILQSGKTERFVFARILFIANSNKTSLKKLHDSREHFLPRQTAQSQIFLHPFSNV